jgi:hypothetical protein
VITGVYGEAQLVPFDQVPDQAIPTPDDWQARQRRLPKKSARSIKVPVAEPRSVGAAECQSRSCIVEKSSQPVETATLPECFGRLALKNRSRLGVGLTGDQGYYTLCTSFVR